VDSPDKLTFLYVNIGRGHPYYLDGIVEQLQKNPNTASIEICDAAELSSGLAGLAWKGVNWLYRHGSSGGPVAEFYARLRRGSDYSRQQFSLGVLARNLRKQFMGATSPLIVSHPILVAALAGRRNLIYQHGELVAPAESCGPGASTVLVPTPQVAELFRQRGYSKDQLFISGLCIEPCLEAIATDTYRLRQERATRAVPLVGIFMSSGAEPTQHVRHIVESITSCLNGGVRALVLARKGGRLETDLRAVCKADQIELLTDPDLGSIDSTMPRCVLLSFKSHDEDSKMLAEVISRADFLVGPSHERTNWAVGLGLPMFVLTPCIGPYAPLNLQLLQESGTARVIQSISDARRLGETVTELRKSGQMAQMAEAGWGRYRLDGFKRIADFLTGSD
jgi:hypothetical protein